MNKYIKVIVSLISMFLGMCLILSVSVESIILAIIIFSVYYVHNYYLFKVLFNNECADDTEKTQLIDFIKDVMTNKDGNLKEYIIDDFCNNYCEYRVDGGCIYSMIDEEDYCHYMDDKNLFDKWLEERELK